MQGNVKHHNMTICVCGNIAVKINLCVCFYSSTLYTPIIYSVTVRQYVCVCVICICVNYALLLCYWHCNSDTCSLIELKGCGTHLCWGFLMYTYIKKSWCTPTLKVLIHTYIKIHNPTSHVSRSLDTHLMFVCLLFVLCNTRQIKRYLVQ